MSLENAFQRGQMGGQDRVGRILALTERMRDLDRAIDMIRYDSNLVTELGDALRLLGDAKDAAVAELKTA